jgi:hypothetical protein
MFVRDTPEPGIVFIVVRLDPNIHLIGLYLGLPDSHTKCIVRRESCGSGVGFKSIQHRGLPRRRRRFEVGPHAGSIPLRKPQEVLNERERTPWQPILNFIRPEVRAAAQGTRELSSLTVLARLEERIPITRTVFLTHLGLHRRSTG